MTAINKAALSVVAGIVEVALIDDEVPALLDNMTNADDVITAVDALTFIRMASVTDVKININPVETKIEQRADDTGIIYMSSTSGVKVSFNWFEMGDVAAIKLLLGISSLDVAAAGEVPAHKILGQNIKNSEMPRVVVRITGMDDEDSHKELFYVYDAGLTSEIQRAFVDLDRTAEIPGTPAEFTINKGGFRLNKTERLPA